LSEAIKDQISVLQRELQIARHQVIILTEINKEQGYEIDRLKEALNSAQAKTT
jgi:hypothetical protein